MTPRLSLLSHAATPALRAASFPLDEELDARGITSAQKLAGRFGVPARVLSSPALRARQTVEALGLQAESEAMLAECDYGRWAGLAFEAVVGAEPEGLAAWTADPDACPHGGESVSNLIRRVGAWLDQLRVDGHVLAVTHASVMRAAVVHVLGADARMFWRIEAAPLAIADLRPSSRGWSLRLGG
ncbi:histidine phosphatase family protein [Labrys neptuniae]